MTKAVGIATALLIIIAALVARASAAPEPVEIDVLLSLTGTSSFIGTTEAQSLAVVQKMINAAGGIAGRPVNFVIADDASNPQTTLQLTNALIAKHANVIIGPSYTSGCNAIAPLIERAGPVDYCLSPGIHVAAGGYVYSAGAGTDTTAAAELRYFRLRGLKRIALIALTDASGQDHEQQLNAALRLPENKDLELVASEHYNPADVSVAAQLARIKAANPQGLITSATGVAFGTVLRNLADAGLDLPTTASAGDMSYAQMQQYKSFAPKDLLFMATHGVAPDPAVTSGSLRDAQSAYFKNLQAANVQPTYLASLAWDPAFIVVDALRHVGPNASPEAVHRYLSGLHGWSGINGLYDFRASQRGLGPDAVVVYRWDPQTDGFAIVPTVPAPHAKTS